MEVSCNNETNLFVVFIEDFHVWKPVIFNGAQPASWDVSKNERLVSNSLSIVQSELTFTWSAHDWAEEFGQARCFFFHNSHFIFSLFELELSVIEPSAAAVPILLEYKIPTFSLFVLPEVSSVASSVIMLDLVLSDRYCNTC